MKIAIVAAGFSPAEADKLRRAMATFRRVGTIATFQAKMVEGMAAKGYEREFAERCFRQIEGFGEYGFPESHAASFALIVYASCWMKCRYPDVVRRRDAQFAAARLLRARRNWCATRANTASRCGRWMSICPTGTARWRKLPSPLAGEGGGRSPPDEGSRREARPTARPLIRRRFAPPPSPARGEERRSTPATPRWPSISARRTRCGWAFARSSARAKRRCASSSRRARRATIRCAISGCARAEPRRAGAPRRRRRVPLARPRPAPGAVGGARPRPRRRSGRSAAVRRAAARSARASPTRNCRRCRSAPMSSRIIAAFRCR